jgi:SAM-dependent methyltransferase
MEREPNGTRGAFLRGGLGSLDDLASPEWRESFPTLEAAQAEFLALRPHTAGYRWVKDALHNCIRVWEYPFVYTNLRAFIAENPARRPFIVDLGSGATFFPFAVARLGARVLALDNDLDSVRSLDNARRTLDTGSGAVESAEADIRRLKLADASVDCMYCISVLEHLEDPETPLAEIARVLRPGGLLILTFDIDLRGNSAIGPEAFARIQRAIAARFEPCHEVAFVHPMRVLTTENSPYPYYPPVSPLGRIAGAALDLVRGLAGRPNRTRILASTYGTCLRLRPATPQP